MFEALPPLHHYEFMMCSTLRMYPAVRFCGHRSKGKFREIFPSHACHNDARASSVSFYHQSALEAMPLAVPRASAGKSVLSVSLCFLLNESWNHTSWEYCRFCQPTHDYMLSGHCYVFFLSSAILFKTRTWKQKKGDTRTAGSYVITSHFYEYSVVWLQAGRELWNQSSYQ
jgi:hypothetical protein